LHIDEIAHKKGQGQFMTIISDDENVRETVIGKSYEDVKKKILAIPDISNVQKVCIDMCAPFAKAIREAIPNAVTVADRFHIMKKVNEILWNLNKKTFKNLDEKERERFSNIRFLLVKYRKHLKKWEKRQIKDYLKLNTEIKEFYWKVQEFREILFNYQGYKHSFVSQKLTEWMNGIRKYLGKFAKTLEKWWDEVVNACIYKENNARQEGINNKIKMMKRRGYGYRNWLNFEFRIYGECNP
jgi:transposase